VTCQLPILGHDSIEENSVLATARLYYDTSSSRRRRRRLSSRTIWGDFEGSSPLTQLWNDQQLFSETSSASSSVVSSQSKPPKSWPKSPFPFAFSGVFKGKKLFWEPPEDCLLPPECESWNASPAWWGLNGYHRWEQRCDDTRLATRDFSVGKEGPRRAPAADGVGGRHY